MVSSFKGKTVVVTGGSKGIGAGIARYFGSHGAQVVVNYSSSKPEAEKIVEEINKTGKGTAIQANMSKPEEIEHLFKETKKVFGSLDILINNAGIYEFAPLQQITVEHFHKLFDLNVLGLLLSSREALKYFKPNGGAIVNISSVVSSSAFAEMAVYSATKAAVDAITKSLAKELGPKKIRVNSVNPGMVETEGTRSSGINESDLRRHTEATTPLGRIGQPDDIAPAVAFLASDEASWITGETLYISGGFR